MTTDNRTNDSTQLLQNDETRTLDNETALAEENTVLDEDAREEESRDEESNIAKPAKKKKVDNGNIIAASVGAVAGGVAGGAIGARAASDGKKDIELKDEKDGDNVEKDIAPDAEVTDEDVAVDGAVDVTDSIGSDAANAVNINVNIDANGQYQVSGPNPAEAAAKLDPASSVHEAGRQMHNTYSSGEEAKTTVEPSEEPTVNMGNGEMLVEESQIPQANVSDSMSFSEAFAAARAEVGPGGSFTWHGQVYGTYYEAEWNSMSAAEQRDFQLAALNADPASAGEPVTVEPTANSYASAKPAGFEEPSEFEPGEPVTLVDPEPVGDDEVRVLGIDSVVGEDGQTHEAAIIDFGGEVAMVVDTDSDNVYDHLIADFNGDGEITSDEINSDFGQVGLTVDEVHEHYQEQVNIEQQFELDDNAAMNDFDNSADITDFV